MASEIALLLNRATIEIAVEAWEIIEEGRAFFCPPHFKIGRKIAGRIPDTAQTAWLQLRKYQRKRMPADEFEKAVLLEKRQRMLEIIKYQLKSQLGELSSRQISSLIIDQKWRIWQRRYAYNKKRR
jgi:hypothetical protein